MNLSWVMKSAAGRWVKLGLVGLGLAVPGQWDAAVHAATAPGITLGEAADGPGLTWVTNGFYGWFGQTEVTHDAVDAVQSGPLGDGQTNTLQTTIVGPGVFTFYCKVSSETNHDFLNFYIDSFLITSLSGDTDWTRVAYNMPAGTWTLEWDYVKDGSGKARADAGWLDQFFYVPITNPPVFVVQPQSRSMLLGGYVSLESEPIGAPPFTWQWQQDGTNLPGATNWILQLGNVQSDQAGEYRVLVGNTNGSTLSAAATVSLVSATLQPADLTERNAPDWSGFAHDGVLPVVSNDTTLVQVGHQSIHWISQSATDTGVAYPRAADAHWRLTNSDSLAFWIYPLTTNSAAGLVVPPTVVLKTTTGDFVFTPQDLNLTNQAWNCFQVPLAGSPQWQRTNVNSPFTSGASFLDDVNQLEFHAPANSSGFTACLDGVRFLTAGPVFTDVIATHRAEGYVPGGDVTVTCTLTYTTAPPALAWSVTPPPNWSYVSGSGEPAQKPVAGQTGPLAWNWTNPPTGPMTFTYSLRVPSAEIGLNTIQGAASYRIVGSPTTIPASPDPLQLPQVTYHTADYRGPFWQIDGTEVNRVLSYWRAGGYHRDTNGVDGFAPGPGATNGSRHAADYRNAAWVIDGTEVNRVLSYWRAAGYHWDTNGVDGFAPGAP